MLHRIGRSPSVAREQLEHLLEMGNRPNVHIQILPLEAAIPAEQYAPFTLFSLSGEPSIDVTWLEHVTGGTLLEQRTDVQMYTRVWDEFTAAALSPSASEKCIRDLL